MEKKIRDKVIKVSKKQFEEDAQAISPYIIEISNGDGFIKIARIFGHIPFFNTPNFGSEKGLHVANGYADSDYFAILAETVNGVDFPLIRIVSENENQLMQKITVLSKNATGCGTKRNINCKRIYKSTISNGQTQRNTIEITQGVRITPDAWLEFSVLPRTRLRIEAFPRVAFKDSLFRELVPEKTGPITALVKALESDKGYWEVFEANIAMAYKDNYRWYQEETGKKVMNRQDRHIIANNAAKYFLKLLCKESRK